MCTSAQFSLLSVAAHSLFPICFHARKIWLTAGKNRCIVVWMKKWGCLKSTIEQLKNALGYQKYRKIARFSA
jgi:hypothetical protein